LSIVFVYGWMNITIYGCSGATIYGIRSVSER
jgi:hypothetical protein